MGHELSGLLIFGQYSIKIVIGADDLGVLGAVVEM
jgi:hypothetical protein